MSGLETTQLTVIVPFASIVYARLRGQGSGDFSTENEQVSFTNVCTSLLRKIS